MITKELVDYVTSQRALGKLDAEIKQNLLNGGGWNPADLEELFSGHVPQKSKSHKPLIIGIVFMIVVLSVGFFLFGYQGIFVQKTVQTQETVPQKSLTMSEFLTSEEAFYKEYYTFGMPVSSIRDCSLRKIEALTPEEVAEIRKSAVWNDVIDSMKKVGASCFDDFMSNARKHQDSIKKSLASLTERASAVEKDARVDAVALADLWNTVTPMTYSAVISRVETTWNAVVASSTGDKDPLGTYYEMDKKNYDWSRTELNKSLDSYWETRFKIISKYKETPIQTAIFTSMDKGKDAGIKANLSSIRPAAEISYDRLNNYNGVCGSYGQAQDTMIVAAINNIQSLSGEKPVCVTRGNPATAYAISAKLSGATGILYWCIDSLGASQGIAKSVGESAACNK